MNNTNHICYINCQSGQTNNKHTSCIPCQSGHSGPTNNRNRKLIVNGNKQIVHELSKSS